MPASLRQRAGPTWPRCRSPHAAAGRIADGCICAHATALPLPGPRARGPARCTAAPGAGRCRGARLAAAGHLATHAAGAAHRAAAKLLLLLRVPRAGCPSAPGPPAIHAHPHSAGILGIPALCTSSIKLTPPHIRGRLACCDPPPAASHTPPRRRRACYAFLRCNARAAHPCPGGQPHPGTPPLTLSAQSSRSDQECARPRS